LKNYIDKPLTNNNWDPSSGDYVNLKILEEDLNYKKKQKRKTAFVTFLVFTHIILLLIIFLLY
jgi:hypothetical protein